MVTVYHPKYGLVRTVPEHWRFASVHITHLNGTEYVPSDELYTLDEYELLLEEYQRNY